jgi:hypothetical protein
VYTSPAAPAPSHPLSNNWWLAPSAREVPGHFGGDQDHRQLDQKQLESHYFDRCI